MAKRWLIVVALALLCWLPTARGDTIPDLQPGTTVQVREGDIWSDATFVKKEGHRALIKYSDGTTEWIGPDRLRVPGGTPATPPANVTPSDSGTSTPAAADNGAGSMASTPSSDAGPGRISGAPTPLANKDITINLDNAPQSQERLDAGSLAHAVAPVAEEFERFGMSDSEFRGFMKDMLRCADTPDIIVSVHDHDNQSVLGKVNIATHSGVQTLVVPVKADELRGIGSDAKFAASVTMHGFDSGPIQQWIYESGSYHPRATITLTLSSDKFNCGRIWPIGGDRLIVDRQREGLYLINLPAGKVEAFCKHSWDDPKLTPDGREIMVRQDDNILLLRTSDLSIAASIPAEHSSGRFAVDPSCTYLAYNAQDRIHVVKIATGDEVGTVVAGRSGGDLFLLSDQFIALDHGQSLDAYDVHSGYPFWSYKRERLSHYELLGTGQFLFSFDDGTFALAKLPGAKELASLKNISPDQYSLSPGTAIAVKGDPGVFNSTGQEVKSTVEGALKSAGHKLGSDFSPYVLDWTSAAGPTDNRKFYHTIFPGAPMTTGAAIDVSCPSTIVTVTLTYKDQEIWNTTLKFQAAPYMQLPPGITPQEAANAAAKPQVGRLAGIQIPTFLLKGAAAGASISPMVSTITPTGIEAGDVAPATPHRRR